MRRLPPSLRLALACFLCAVLTAMLPTIAASQSNDASSPRIMDTALLHDPTGQLTAADLVDREAAFRPVERRADLQLGYTAHPVWLRIRLAPPEATSAEAMLRFIYPFLEQVSLYRVRDGEMREVRHSGLTVAPERRALAHRLPVFPLRLAPGESVTLLARVDTASSMMLDFEVMEATAFHAATDRENFWFATYFGMLTALGLYNLLLFAGLRERVFLLYSLFVSSFCAAVLTANGLGPLIFWGGLGEATTRIVTLGFTLSAALGTLFARGFLNTAHYSPRWHRVLGWLLVGCLAGVTGALLLPRQQALQAMDLVGLTTCLLLLACAVTCAVRRVPGARLFVLAWAFLLTGASVFALRNLGVLPSNVYTLYGIQVGSALEMLLLSFALAARFNAIKRQKERAQAQLVTSLRTQESILEERVAERTAELEAMANRDMLTGLLNRSGLADCAAEALQRSRTTGRPLTLLMLDLDDFKPINDRLGHAAGDFVLQRVAQRLRHQARQYDHCARFGGDEFLLLAEGVATPADAIELQKRLANAIRQPIRLPDGTLVRVDVSIGFSLGDARTPDLETLLRQADMATYAKKQGRQVSPRHADGLDALGD